ncbi:MAG TPA: glycoside hydrolase family 44 protein [Tepidisphaeraceae bacterium]|jgi:hypothetical protein
MSTVHFAIDAQQSVHPISRFIYGVNQSLSGAYSNLTLTRDGGNRWTAYNWENNASNAGSDFQFQNDSFLGGGNTPGGAISPMLSNAAAHNAGAIVTIPINGYVSADKNGGGDVRNSGPNYLQTRFKQELPRKGSAFSLTPDTTDGFVYQDEFVNWVKTNYPYGQTDPNKPIWFELDNEPDLWNSTHAEVHPNAPTYAEMVQKTVDYSGAIKDVEPNALVFGPVNYGWQGYIRLQSAPDANNRDFQQFFLQQMQQASQTAGRRLLDVMDVHWYPEATGTNGVRIINNDNTAPTVAARLQAPRSLWDPTYTESSWITQFSTLGPINLIPRLQTKINTYYPGTKLAITEYNYGGGNDISGAIAQADVLGIFGRDGIFAANEWPLSGTEPFIAGGFNMFRNYDGGNSTFGDTSIKASTDDVPDSSVYASLDSAHPGVLTIVAINKTAAPLPAALSLGHIRAQSSASVYQLTSVSATPQSAGTLTITDPANINYTMPAYSVSTIRVNLVVPAVTAADVQQETAPNKLSFTFNTDVSASLTAADLVLSPLAGGPAVPVTLLGYDSASNTATFSLPTPLPDGNYRATIAAGSIEDVSHNPSTSASSSDFFVLAGDANHDRKVNETDLGILSLNWGQTGRTFSQGNFDYSPDGLVNIDDLNILASHWQQTLALPTASPLSPFVGTPVKRTTTRVAEQILA